MRRVALLLLMPALLAAADWVKFTSGPFEVLTDAGARPGREAMVRFLEFRHAVGQIVGEPELGTPLPVRVLVLKNPRGWTSDQPISEGRDRYNIVLPEKSSGSPALYAELTKLFLQANTKQMPPTFERGLVAFFSTTEISGISITVGAPPPQPDVDWARIHLLVASPEYFGKMRVLLSNLRRGVDEEPAYRNAFGKSRAEVEAEAKRHFAAGKFGTTSLNSRPLSERDFPERAVSDADAKLARADLLAGKQSTAEYQALLKDGVKIAESEEGLGLLALRDGAKDEARRHFSLAMEAGTPSARAYIEYAKLEPDYPKAEQALLKAAGINAKLDEPFALMAARDTDPRKRLAHLKAAAERNPRNIQYWQSLAECYLADHNYSEAAKAWRQGEQAATDPAVREKMRSARAAIEQQRLDYEAAEKQRAADEEARDLERLKAEARAEVKALEAKYNKGTPKSDAPVVQWWEGPKPDKRVVGTLRQIDCLGAQARLTVAAEGGATVKLLVVDPGKILLTGAGELSLGCGAQKARRVIIGYWAKNNPRLATSGEVATIEFQ